jgi:hypothetical protein
LQCFASADRIDLPSENFSAAGELTRSKRKNIMGDRSPKSVHKQAAQKQSKESDAAKKKQQATAAKQLGNKGR